MSGGVGHRSAHLSVLTSARAIGPLLAAVDGEVEALVATPGEGLIAAAAVAARTGARLLTTAPDASGVEATGVGGSAGDGLPERLAVLGIAPSRARRVLVRVDADGATVMTTALDGDEPRTVGRVASSEDGAVGRAARWSERSLLSGRAARRSAFDIDGVLCRDPAPEEDDGGERYASFLRTAEPLLLPVAPVDRIVTSRLERDRAATEAWLASHGVRHRRLEMIDLPTHEQRLRPWVAERHKAAVLSASGARLYVESDPKQAKRISALSGRAVLCLTTGEYHPARWRARVKHRLLGPPAHG